MNIPWDEWAKMVEQRPEWAELVHDRDRDREPPVYTVGAGVPVVAKGRREGGRRRAALDELGRNKLEAAFHEEAKVWTPERFTVVAFEPLKLRLAGNTSYTPDFLLIDRESRWFLIDVKGYMEDDAAVKIKVAAKAHPYFRFGLVARRKVGDGRRWFVRHVSPLSGIHKPIALDCLGDLADHV